MILSLFGAVSKLTIDMAGYSLAGSELIIQLPSVVCFISNFTSTNYTLEYNMPFNVFIYKNTFDHNYNFEVYFSSEPPVNESWRIFCNSKYISTHWKHCYSSSLPYSTMHGHRATTFYSQLLLWIPELYSDCLGLSYSYLQLRNTIQVE